ncbi:Glycogen recognition site of AMP-activated protein kinase [Saccharicrinis carchari]|uniref:Glycogen recognition site of AMP-activated protein kinase n=1 Tax=Saccharicrinis carchari TaxID=1168039 RepID=A0A521C311_SACCC|nr:isoamylase early set domain-containing protein [Saccharicrinis carchari]SMO53784.1 Glycogen recognition site of AMP-activated protein kinase [Saccharicrinis carchari]
MSIKKQFLKSKPECKVTFKFVKKADLKPKTVKVIGDFNNWDENAEPMKALKSGDFTQTINLSTNAQYQFRYLVDGSQWYNDEQADGYKDAGLGNSEQNSVLHL